MSIELIDKIEPKNNGSFPMVDAKYVLMASGKRLSEEFNGKFQLPKVTDADNGKFLRVVDAAWAAVELQDVSEVGL